MQNRKKTALLLLTGVAIGIIISVIVGIAVHIVIAKKPSDITQAAIAGADVPQSKSSSVSSKPISSIEDIPSSQETTISTEMANSTIEIANENDTWSGDMVYNGGEQVQYDGKIYRAKWWTQGEKPNSSNNDGAWKFIKELPTQKPQQQIDKNEPPIIPSNKNDSSFKVVGYYPDWQSNKMDRIQHDVVTHIIYAFAIPKQDGTLRPLDNPTTAKKLIAQAHKNNTKVLIAVGGWSYNDVPLEPTFKEATNTDEKINKFVASIIAMVEEYGFDGVDIDWEHPRYADVSQEQYEKLIVALSKETKKRDLLLTCAVLSGVSADGNILYDAAAHTNTVLNCLDWINVMAYDGGDGDRHSSYDFAINSANYWINTRKLPQEKVVLGVPFYARPSWASYDAVLEANANADKADISNINGMEAHYNGIETMKNKAKWAKENAGGIMIWELSQDTTDKEKSLLTAIGKVVQ